MMPRVPHLARVRALSQTDQSYNCFRFFSEALGAICNYNWNPVILVQQLRSVLQCGVCQSDMTVELNRERGDVLTKRKHGMVLYLRPIHLDEGFLKHRQALYEMARSRKLLDVVKALIRALNFRCESDNVISQRPHFLFRPGMSSSLAPPIMNEGGQHSEADCDQCADRLRPARRSGMALHPTKHNVRFERTCIPAHGALIA